MDIEKLPKHVALYLSHNDHKSYYRTVRQAVEDEEHGYDDWVSEEEKAKAIENDECWFVQIYPDTPIGFRTLAAHSLASLLGAMEEMKKEEEA